jgi:hypothetical protein
VLVTAVKLFSILELDEVVCFLLTEITFGIVDSLVAV